MSAAILVIDIETQRSVVETFDLWPKYIPIDRVVKPGRVLCFAAKWTDDDDTMFHAAWDDDNVEAYDLMVKEAWTLLDQADIVVGYNSTRFDLQHLQAAFGRLELGPPSPYRSLDLFQVAKKNFKAGELSLKLDWFSKMWLGDRKTSHSGRDLWHDIRYGTAAEKSNAQKIMQEYNCLTPDHKVLTTELRWVEIGSLNLGDEILGFDEHLPAAGNGRRWRRSVVTGNRRTEDDVYLVTLSNGDQIKCTGDHRWLTTKATSAGKNLGGKEWVTTSELRAASEYPFGKPGRNLGGSYGGPSFVLKYLNVVDEVSDKDAGWLAGMFDGEGSLSVRKLGGKQAETHAVVGGFNIGVSQKCGPELDRIVQLLDHYGVAHGEQRIKGDYFAEKSNGAIKSTLPIGQVSIGKFVNQLDFLQKIRPERLISKIDWDSLPRMEGRNACVYVQSVEHIGRMEIVILETSTGTFVADGYAMHNCHDVELTEQLFERFKPWTGINYALYDADADDGTPRCTKCASSNVHRRGYFYTTTFAYQRYHCNDCGSWSRGRKMTYTTELRPV